MHMNINSSDDTAAEHSNVTISQQTIPINNNIDPSSLL